MWTLGFSVGPTWSTRWDRCARVKAKPYLGLTNYINSVRPISVIRKQRVCQANSMGPIGYFGETEIIATGNTEFARPSRWDRDPIGETETLRRETERLQSHLGETEIPIGETDLPRVCGSGYDIWTRWRRIEIIGMTEFGLGFRSFVDMGK